MHTTNRSQIIARQLWVAVYACILLSPIVLLLYAPTKGADRQLLFSLSAGFVAYVAMALQLVMPSRLPGVTDTFGIGPLLRLHRAMAWVVVVLVVVHVSVFVNHERKYVDWLWPIHGPLKAQLGWLAAASLLLIIITSIWRGFLRLSYERWRVLHLLLALLATGGAFAHILLISWYSEIDPLRWLVVGMAILALIGVIYLRVFRPFGALGSTYVVDAIIPERGGATTLRLAAHGHLGTSFTPGQFAWLRIDGSPYAVREHPFSFASSALDPAHPSFTIKASGDFTRTIRSLTPGTPVLLDGPHGAYEPTLPTAGFVLTTAGIGITPAMSFLRTAAQGNDRRPYRLIYGARTLAEITFAEELAELAAVLDLELVYVLSQPAPGWTGPTGRITPGLLPSLLPADASARNHFICGPAEMIDATIAALEQIGVPRELVYADRFDSV